MALKLAASRHATHRPLCGVVEFPRKERDVLELLRNGVDHKMMAAGLELSPTTILNRIKRSCERAHVVDESELRLFLLQNPGILFKGAVCLPGLHVAVVRATEVEDGAEPCGCARKECRGVVRISLKETPVRV